MSYDLMVFEKTKAPTTRVEFMNWFAQQTEWSESHDYDNISVASSSLQNWFMEMKETFPPLNGEHAPSDEVIDEMLNDEELGAHLTDYSIGADVIYAGFRWSLAEKANLLMLELAQKHDVGFFDVSSENRDIIFPNGMALDIEAVPEKQTLFTNFPEFDS